MGFSDLTATIGLDARPYNAGLKNAERGALSFSQSFARLGDGIGSRIAGLLGVGAIIGAVRHVTTLAGEIKDASERLGISSDEVQGLRISFQEAGSTAEDATNAVEKLALARDAALGDPNGKESAAFAAVGIDRDALRLQSNFEIVRRIGEELRKNAQSEAQLVSLADIFGERLAGKVRPALKSLDEVYARAADNGEFMLASTIESLDAFAKAEQRTRDKVLNKFGSAIADFGTSGLIAGEGAIKGVRDEKISPFDPLGFFKILRGAIKGVPKQYEQFAEDLAKEFEAQRTASDGVLDTLKAIRARRAAEGDAKAAAEAEKNLFRSKSRFTADTDGLSSIGASAFTFGRGSRTSESPETKATKEVSDKIDQMHATLKAGIGVHSDLRP